MRLVLILALVLSQGPSSTPAVRDTLKNEQNASGTQNSKPEPVPTAEERLAVYTLWLTRFTGVLAVATLGLLFIAYRQGQQIEREFAVAHRPKLRFRRIYFEASATDPQPTRIPDSMGGYTEVPPEGATPPRVIVEMANVGGVGVAKAKLYVTFNIFNTGQPVPGVIQEQLAKAVPDEFEVSHAGSGVLVTPTRNIFADAGVSSGSQSVYCVGYVEYSDETGKLKGRAGFIRRLDIGNRWFERVDFPDFEYAD
jgi:hypothetical protein